MHAAIRQASKLVETASREPLGIPLTLLTISMPRPARAGEPRQQVGQRLRRAFHARRHDARSDHRGFQQAQVIAREIENLGDRARSPRWPPDRRSPGAAPAGRSRGNTLPPAAWGAASGAAHARSIEMFSTRAPSGKSMPRKKMSLQPLWRQVHAHRRGFAQHREQRRRVRRAAVRAAGAADNPPDGRCGTSTGCRAPSARCAAPGRPASESPSPR